MTGEAESRRRKKAPEERGRGWRSGLLFWTLAAHELGYGVNGRGQGRRTRSISLPYSLPATFGEEGSVGRLALSANGGKHIQKPFDFSHATQDQDPPP